MAKLYTQLKKALSSYEDRPEGLITEADIGDFAFIIRGKDQGCAAWHCILVSIDKVAAFRALGDGGILDITQFGRVIEYRNHRGEIKPLSGWGKDPPQMIETWVGDNYGERSIDPGISMIYENDDIRLCTMQRAVSTQLLGVSFCYFKRQKPFHYIKLLEGVPLSLARRSGIKNYDRIIFFNGVNIENDTQDQFVARFEAHRHLPVQMLVCSPATYEHYKANNKSFRIDLPTVQRLTPVYATTASDSNTDTPTVSADPDSFCSIRWDDSDIVSTVSQSSVYKSPEFTKVNDICFVEREGNYGRGKILHIGSYNECENVKTLSILQKNAMNINSESTSFKFIPQESVDSVPCTLEQLPNEIFLDIFTYLNIADLYNAFWGLTARFNSLFQSSENLCLTFEEKTDQLLMESYAHFITRLIIDTPKKCDLTKFPNLQTLVLCDRNSENLEQIQPDIVPKLSHLSFLLGSDFTPSSELIAHVLSNEFPSLRHVSLSRVDVVSLVNWSTSPSLRFVSIRSNEPLIVSCILTSCPYLDHLQLHVCDKIDPDAASFPPDDHPLSWFNLWSDSIQLTSTEIADLLSNTPNIRRLYLQTVCSEEPFISMANNLTNRLNSVSHFDCHIKEMTSKADRIDELTAIQQVHPCFSRIECDDKDEDFRIFHTK